MKDYTARQKSLFNPPRAYCSFHLNQHAPAPMLKPYTSSLIYCHWSTDSKVRYGNRPFALCQSQVWDLEAPLKVMYVYTCMLWIFQILWWSARTVCRVESLTAAVVWYMFYDLYGMCWNILNGWQVHSRYESRDHLLGHLYYSVCTRINKPQLLIVCKLCQTILLIFVSSLYMVILCITVSSP